MREIFPPQIGIIKILDMKKIVFGLIGLAMFACQSVPVGYKINGHIEGAGDGIAVLMKNVGFESSTGGDTVKLKRGSFTFTGKLDEPTRVVIAICPENEKSANLGLIAENTAITISGNWDNVVESYGYRGFSDSDVKGSVNESVYRECNELDETLLKEPRFEACAAAQKKLTELRNGSDKEAFYKYQEETEGLFEEFRDVLFQELKELILKNKTVESVVLVLHSMQGNMEFKELEQMFNSLAPNVQNSLFAQEVKEELEARRRTQPGQPAPDFTLKTPEGSDLSLSDLHGKYVVLDFWASWCRPCRASFPEMKKLYAEYKNRHVEILGVSDDFRKDDWLKALEEDQLPWLQVIDEFPVPHKPSRVGTLYAIHYLPTLILIDPDGKMVGKPKDKHELRVWLDERLGKK